MASMSLNGIAPLSNAELDQVSGGLFPFIALGVALGIAYCIADGTLDPPPAPKGDFPTGPKNAA
jgi:lactobin A/cerein 7B family class IIb bacteriocin